MVEDDGEGFDTSTWESDLDTNTENAEAIAHRKNVGLKNVRDRIRDMCGGRMEIQSIIGEGTKVLLIIPVSQQTQKEEAGKKKVFSRREKK
jgi:sensor histidine kinase YesM